MFLKNRTGGADECIKFPLEESDVNEIIDLFEPSPYGKGAETIVDTAVRSSFQLNPDGFEVKKIEAKLYVFVLYPRITDLKFGLGQVYQNGSGISCQTRTVA